MTKFLNLRRYLANIVSWFIAGRERRHKVKDFILYYNPAKRAALLKQQADSDEIFFIDKNPNSPKKILHYSTFNVQCGIAKFLDNCILGLQENGYCYNAVVPVNYDYLLDISTLLSYLDKIINYAKDFDVVEIQHEYEFWKCKNMYSKLLRKVSLFADKYKYTKTSFSLVLLDYFIERLLDLGKEIRIVWHSDFGFALEDLAKVNEWESFEDLPFFRFMENPNLKIVVMNSKMLESLGKFGIPAGNVKVLPHFVKSGYRRQKSGPKTSSGEVILAGFGFVSAYKGIMNNIKLLEFLPENYKYLHIGGVHPEDSSGYFDAVKEFVKEHGLENRVKFTGFIETDEEIETYLDSINLGLYLTSSKGVYASGAITVFLQNGIPVITSDALVFRDLSTNYDCVEVCGNAEDYKNIANHIVKLIADDKRQEALKRNCETFCRENTPQKFIAKMYEIEPVNAYSQN